MRVVPLIALAVPLLAACGPGEAPRGDAGPPAAAMADAPLVVYTVNDPLRYFAERIGGTEADVHFPAPKEVVDPAAFRPMPESVVAYQAADLVVLNGAGYAKWVRRASLRDSRLLDTSRSFAQQAIPLVAEVTHRHGPQGEHVHAGVATTFWLDVELARAQARAIAERLREERPEGEVGFRSRHAALDAELATLDLAIQRAAERLREEQVLFSHPVYEYFARRYGVSGRSLHWEPDEAPSEAMWRELEVLLAQQPVRLMLWEDEPLPETFARLGQLGIEVVVYEPAGGAAPGRDFLARMRANAERLADAAKLVDAS